MPCLEALNSYDPETLRKCKEEGAYCYSSRYVNKEKHTFLFSYIISPFLWLPLAVTGFDHNSDASVRYLFFQCLPEEIQRMEFGWRTCLTILEGARPASGYNARSQTVVCSLSCFLFTFQFLCITGSLESFVTVHVASCTTKVLNIPKKKYEHILLVSFQKNKLINSPSLYQSLACNISPVTAAEN